MRKADVGSSLFRRCYCLLFVGTHNPARDADRPTVQQLLVFCLEAAIGSPVHVPRLGRDLVEFGASSPTKTLPQPFGLIERALNAGSLFEACTRP
jgi:hypothetical protein